MVLQSALELDTETKIGLGVPRERPKSSDEIIWAKERREAQVVRQPVPGVSK